MAETVHTGAVKILTPLAALAIAVAITSCSSSEDAAIEPSPATASPTPTELPTKEGLGSASAACEALIDPEAAVLSLTRDGGVLDDDVLLEWGFEVHSIGNKAAESPDVYIANHGDRIVRYVDDNDGAFTRGELYERAFALFEACQGSYIDPDWVAIPWPDEDAKDAFLQGVLISAIAGADVYSQAEDLFPIGLESCQRIADEHNRTGSVPDFDFLHEEIQGFTDENEVEPAAMVSVVADAIANFCPDYMSIIENAR